MAKQIRTDREYKDLYGTSAATRFNSLVIKKLRRALLADAGVELLTLFLKEYSARLARMKTPQDGEYTCSLVCKLDDNLKKRLLVHQLRKILKAVSMLATSPLGLLITLGSRSYYIAGDTVVQTIAPGHHKNQ